MALLRRSQSSLLILGRRGRSVFESSIASISSNQKMETLTNQSMDEADSGRDDQKPLRKEISFQQYEDEFVKRGNENPYDWVDYKNNEYLNWNKWSYYDLEVKLTKHRLPQPDPGVPDKPRDTKQSTSSPPPDEKKATPPSEKK